jgi:phosphonate C-P lyase system protein PhnG
MDSQRSGPDAPSDRPGPDGLKAELQAGLAVAERADLLAALDRLWACGRFSVERAPQPGLVMCTVLDPFDVAFHLGEILVTRADVTMDARHRGCAVVQGDAPEAALLLAAVEAAERGGAALLDGLAEWAGELRERRDAQRARESRCAAATRVRFESMRKERVDFGSLGG